MILIPAGNFTMGSPEGVGYGNERPQRTIYLDAYRIHKYEVTNAQYAAFLNAAQPSDSDRRTWIWLNNEDSDTKIEYTGGVYVAMSGWEDHPVVNVSWHGANAYAEYYGMTLPTEAQWEKAARGSSDDRQYPWGDTWDRERVNAHGTPAPDTWEHTSPVGSFPSGASPYGLMDMAGNVREWCRDWYASAYYSIMPGSNPYNNINAGDDGRVLRGGCWNLSNPDVFRVAVRVTERPSNLYDTIGFRCAAAP